MRKSYKIHRQNFIFRRTCYVMHKPSYKIHRQVKMSSFEPTNQPKLNGDHWWNHCQHLGRFLGGNFIKRSLLVTTSQRTKPPAILYNTVKVFNFAGTIFFTNRQCPPFLKLKYWNQGFRQPAVLAVIITASFEYIHGQKKKDLFLGLSFS